MRSQYKPSILVSIKFSMIVNISLYLHLPQVAGFFASFFIRLMI